MFLDWLDNLGRLELAIVGVAGLVVFGRPLMNIALRLLDRRLGP